VTELCEAISIQLGASSLLKATTVRGEVVDPRVVKGHTYFTLRDATSAFECIRWANVLGEPLVSGRVYDVTGDVALWPVKGQIRFITSRVRQLDAGERQRALEELTERLRLEGIFDTARKQVLPNWPSRIGVATSADGAVIHDVTSVIGTRMPLTEIVLAPCPVQGIGAAGGIVEAIWALARSDVDIIVVARGGGSADDLAAYNDEAVVRAVRSVSEQAGIPVVSAVGHETDTTLCDHAADLRAPTPSAAAQRVVPDAAAVRGTLLTCGRRLKQAMGARIAARAREHMAIDRRLNLASNLIARRVQVRLDAIQRTLIGSVPARVSAVSSRVDSLEDRARAAIMARIAQLTTRLGAAESTLRLLSPLRVLERGYAIIETLPDVGCQPSAIATSAGLRPGDAVRVRFTDGIAEATVRAVIRTSLSSTPDETLSPQGES
jgi:exodeoxyribonuclease VII large subunit